MIEKIHTKDIEYMNNIFQTFNSGSKEGAST